VLGNKAVTMFANALFNTWISDLETCYKLMPLALYRDLDIRSAGFGTEAEVTGKLLKRGQLPYEVPISYKARRREAGKKLTWRDGVEALWILTRVRLFGSQPSQQVRSASTGQPDLAVSSPSTSSHPHPHQGGSRAAEDPSGDER
jgi:hypothetical protein